MPVILTTQEAETRRIEVRSQPGQIVHKSKMDWRCGSISTTPALQAWRPEFKPQYRKRKKISTLGPSSQSFSPPHFILPSLFPAFTFNKTLMLLWNLCILYWILWDTKETELMWDYPPVTILATWSPRQEEFLYPGVGEQSGQHS
jgi:hypothetical protein